MADNRRKSRPIDGAGDHVEYEPDPPFAACAHVLPDGGRTVGLQLDVVALGDERIREATSGMVSSSPPRTVTACHRVGSFAQPSSAVHH
jgi:hypothetical protein